jgi:Tol biopolymer transport system component
MSADWSHDGKTLAVVRLLNGSSQLEFPPGKPLYKTPGWISSIRFSPGGDVIAFLDHPVRHDDAGSLKIVTPQGSVRSITESWASLSGIAWHPSGKEIWFTGKRDSEPRAVWAVTVFGKLRPVAQAPGTLTLRDIAADGRTLVSRESRSLEMSGRLSGDSSDRDFSWLDWSRVADVTSEGRLILFDESGEAAGSHTLVYVQNTADRSIIRLGEGVAMAFAPDGRSALLATEDRRHLRFVPVAGGPARDLPDAGLTYQWAKFFPDGERILALASEPRKGLRLYVRSLSGSAPQRLGPEMMIRNAAISPDGATVAVLSADNRLLLFPTAGGAPRTLAATEPLAPLRWSPAGDTIFVQHLRRSGELPARISSIRVSDGRLTLWREIAPVDLMGVDSVTGVIVCADGESLVYSYRRTLSELFLVDGW